jgi:TFIIF-interacting CTD phosphatase-like protein
VKLPFNKIKSKRKTIYKETGGYLPLNTQPGRKTLVLDMDETLVHTDFKPVFKYERTLQVVLDKELTTVYLSLRPGVFEFIGKFHTLDLS